MRRVTFLAVAQPFSGPHYRAICTSGFVVDVMFVVRLPSIIHNRHTRRLLQADPTVVASSTAGPDGDRRM